MVFKWVMILMRCYGTQYSESPAARPQRTQPHIVISSNFRASVLGVLPFSGFPTTPTCRRHRRRPPFPPFNTHASPSQREIGSCCHLGTSWWNKSPLEERCHLEEGSAQMVIVLKSFSLWERARLCVYGNGNLYLAAKKCFSQPLIFTEKQPTETQIFARCSRRNASGTMV